MLEIPELASGNPQLQKAMVKIVKNEQKQLDKIDEKGALNENKIKLVRDLKGKLNDVKDSLVPFKSVTDFKELRGQSSNTNIANISAIDKNLAVPGSYELEVLNLASTNSVMTYGFTDRDKSEVGIGYISFKTPEGEERDIYINSENNTLDGVAKTINDARVGVKAYVVNDGTDAENPWRLVISGEKTGWRNDYEWPEFHMLDGDMDLDLERIREAKSAIVKFNGHPIMADENTLKTLLPGVTIDLKNAKPGEIIKLDVAPDVAKIQDKAKNFVEKMNGVLTFLNNQSQLGEGSRKDPSKALGGDNSLLSLQNRMRSVIQETQSELDASEVRQLRDVGIIFNRNGTLDFAPEVFQKQLETNFEQVAALMSGSGPLSGFSNKMIGLVDSAVRRGDGMMSIKENNLQQSMNRINAEKEQKTKRAEARIEKIKGQFARAEAAIQQMQSSSAQASVLGQG